MARDTSLGFPAHTLPAGLHRAARRNLLTLLFIDNLKRAWFSTHAFPFSA